MPIISFDKYGLKVGYFISSAISLESSSFFDDTTGAAGKACAISLAKFGPEIMAILFFGKNDDTIWLGKRRLLISRPLEQQIKIVLCSIWSLSFDKTLDKY